MSRYAESSKNSTNAIGILDTKERMQYLEELLEQGYKVVMCNKIGNDLEYILEWAGNMSKLQEIVRKYGRYKTTPSC